MLFQLNAPDVVHEELDGEIIVMHLQSGNYYSLVGSGAAIWTDLVVGRLDSDLVVSRLLDRVTAEPGVVISEMDRFFKTLVDESLIVASTSSPGVSAPTEPAVVTGQREPFVPPTIEKYSDMQELLLVDPIHEVDSTGWPATGQNDI